LEVVLFTTSLWVSIEMIVMGKYIHIEGSGREAIVVA
jgi:hypothetical protein